MLMEKTQNDSDSGMPAKRILGARRFTSNRSTLKHVRPSPGRLCKWHLIPAAELHFIFYPDRHPCLSCMWTFISLFQLQRIVQYCTARKMPYCLVPATSQQFLLRYGHWPPLCTRVFRCFHVMSEQKCHIACRSIECNSYMLPIKALLAVQSKLPSSFSERHLPLPSLLVQPLPCQLVSWLPSKRSNESCLRFQFMHLYETLPILSAALLSSAVLAPGSALP